MNEELISFETAKLAREKNFDCNTFYNYDNKGKKFPNSCTPSSMNPDIYRDYYSCGEVDSDFLCRNSFYTIWKNKPTKQCRVFLAPTQSLLQRWLREIHNFEVLIYCNASGWIWDINRAYSKNNLSGGTGIKWSEESGPNGAGQWETYEEALEQGLVEALKLIKDEE